MLQVIFGPKKELSISNSVSHISGLTTTVARPQKSKLQRRIARLFRKKSTRRRAITATVVTGNVLILAVAIGVIAFTPKQGVSNAAVVNDVSDQFTANPLDHVSSAGIAKTVASMSRLPEKIAVTNQADSETIDLALAPTAANVVDKPQVVGSSTYASNKDIKTYTVEANETISSIATKFGITSDSIRWSNNVSGETVAAGTKLQIPPVTGLVYTVQAGDTPTTLAAKYKADQNKITAFNDAELAGLQVGTVILIPDGSKAAAVAAATRPSAAGSNFKGSATYGGYNGYDFGYCTYWVAKLRAQSGNAVPTNLGNAATWAKRAAAMGLPTGSEPRVGAAVVTKTVGAGHVAYVTAVNDDGTITISEMNHSGWNKVNSRVLPASSSYSYVY